MPDATRKLLVIITHQGNNDRASIGFTLANAALSTGVEVGVFLASDGVDLVREHSWEMTQVKPFKPLAELIDGFIEKGGKVWSCGTCIQHRHLDGEKMRGVIVSGIATVVDWINAGAQTVCL